MTLRCQRICRVLLSLDMSPVDTMKFISRNKPKVQRSLLYRWHKRFLLTIDFLGYECLRHAPFRQTFRRFDFAFFPKLKAEDLQTYKNWPQKLYQLLSPTTRHGFMKYTENGYYASGSA